MAEQVEKAPNPLVKIYGEIEQRTEQFHAALPAHIPVERFKRVLLTAIQNNPGLVDSDRRTFFNSAMRAAQDGLLPDGREGAMVIYNTKMKVPAGPKGELVDKWVNAVQWMPMIQGLRKKVRNSGEIATWDVKAVYVKDEFLYEEGIEPILKHKPYIEGPAGELRAVYSVAKLKSGEISIDVMAKWQVDRIRAMSKAKDKGPWVDHYDEMAKKTVARRHSKVLPMSTDLDDLIRRDDDLYDMQSASDKEIGQQARRPQLMDFSDAAQGEAMDEKPLTKTEQAAQAQAQIAHDPQTGEVTGPDADDEPAAEFSAADAYEMGEKAFAEKRSIHSHDKTWEQMGKTDWVEAFKSGWREAEAASKPPQTAK